MQDTISSVVSQPTSPKKKGFPVVALVIVLIVVALIGGFLIMNQSNKEEAPETTITPTQEPQPTEAPTIDKTTVKIQVLNGTGTPGQAGTAVKALVAGGYVEDNITAENAPDYDHTVTTIATKEGFESTAEDIKSALESDFDTVEIDSTALGSSSEFDVVVTTGGKKYEAPTSAPKPTTSSSTPTVTPTGTTSDAATPTPTRTPTPTP